MDALVQHDRVVLLGVVSERMTPDVARELSWKLQNAATEIDGMKVTQVSRDCLPPRGVLILPHTVQSFEESMEGTFGQYDGAMQKLGAR